MSNIKVTIFEDNNSLRNMLYQLINGSDGFECVGTFLDCSNLIKNIDRTKPDVVMMDIGLPGINGIDAVKILKEKFPDLKILIQTIFDDNERIFQAICAGASGYILKNTSPSRILQCLIETYNGGAPISPSIATKVLKMVQLPDNKVKNHSFNLSEREEEVLQYLVRGMSYKLIASHCFLSIDTVRSHIKNIYEKLHVHSKSEAVAKAIQKNIV
jgi:DNA-binding NarL/FixJ family response regulator